MAQQKQAIALCRVSTPEQRKNNSLNRQKESVLKASRELGVTIPDDYWWSGDISSKRGTNVHRTDLQEIISKCKKDKSIKYVIVDEPDRFMRSMDEALYFEVVFKELGVQVWYASDPDLNKGDFAAKVMKFAKYLSAEGSNEERQHKSIQGHMKAINEGRYTFSPKPGYKKGVQPGVQEIHPVKGPLLRSVLLRIVNHQTTPTKALVELNKSAFTTDHSHYKMDKFRKIITDPFYAGVVEIGKQIKTRNEHGLHERLITLDQHYQLIEIMSNKKKNQKGPRKNGNPKFPMNTILSHDTCHDKRSHGKVVGFDHGNGKPSSKVYEKYRCRSCGLYMTRQDVHSEVVTQFKRNPISKEGVEDLLEALDIVWKRQEAQNESELSRIKSKVKSLATLINSQALAAIDPSNALIKDEILANVTKSKQEVADLEKDIISITKQADSDYEEFLRFAFDFAKNTGEQFLKLDPEDKSRCKQIIFPAGFRFNDNKKVYTPEISPLIRLATKKKSTEVLEDSHLVRVRGL